MWRDQLKIFWYVVPVLWNWTSSSTATARWRVESANMGSKIVEQIWHSFASFTLEYTLTSHCWTFSDVSAYILRKVLKCVSISSQSLQTIHSCSLPICALLCHPIFRVTVSWGICLPCRGEGFGRYISKSVPRCIKFLKALNSSLHCMIAAGQGDDMQTSPEW